MKPSIVYFLLTILFLSTPICAQTDLVDPITKKSISYYTTSTKEKSFKLNAFEDIEMLMLVFKNNKLCSDNLKLYLKNLLNDEAYISRFKSHTKASLTHFMTYSSLKNTLSINDKRRLLDQNIEVEEMESLLIFYYNDLIGVKIQANYKMNQGYEDRFQENSSMCHSIYINVNTGKISSLEDFCPPYLQTNFINYLTREKNKLIPNLKLQIDKEEQEVADEENDVEPAHSGKAEIKNANSDVEFLKEKINLIDVVFDVNAFQISCIKNSTNTYSTHGNAFIINVNEDSIKRFIPWVVNSNNSATVPTINPSDMNTKLLQYSYQHPYHFLYQTELKTHFENTRNKRNVTVLYRQNFILDSVFKLQQILRFNPDNTISEMAYDFDITTKEPKSTKAYVYENGRVKKISDYHSKKLNEEHRFDYNRNGFLIKQTSTQDDERDTENTYKYENNLVHECITDEEETNCYTYVFDKLGNLVSRSVKGQKQTYISKYSNSLLMAVGDALYTYNSNNQVIAMERDRGRYYTNYYYDNQNRLTLIKMFDGKELTSKDEILYDSKSRIVFITHTSFSYGKLQTQLQHKIVYDN
jgi:hypothetical protein